MFFWSEHLHPWRSLRSWRPYFLIFVLGFLLYGQTLFFDFTYFDDQELIINKEEILKDVRNIGLIFTNDAFFYADKFYYRPLLNISFMWDAQVGGALAPLFHLDNILFHLLAVGLAFYLLTRLGARREVAFYLSLVFLAHPVLTQAVAWLPGRSDSLLAVFILSSFIAFLNFLRQPRLRSYIFYLLFFLLALLTKETAVVLPVLLLFYVYFIDRGNLERHDKYLLLLGSGAVAFIWFLLRHFALSGQPTDWMAAAWSVINNSPALLVHVGKLLWPFNLSVLPVLADSSLVYGMATVLILATVWFLSKQKRQPYMWFGVMWFFLFLLPSLVRLHDTADFLEHRLYLSFFGFLLVLAEFDFIKNIDFSRRATKIVAGASLSLLFLLTLWHSRSFSDRLTFWRAAATSSPHSALAQRNLGVMYYFMGDVPAAILYYTKALALNPREAMVHNNLGVIYMNQRNWVLAEQEFRAELAINPNYDKALFNIGDLLVNIGRESEAVVWFESALKSNPYYWEAYERLLILNKRLR